MYFQNIYYVNCQNSSNRFFLRNNSNANKLVFYLTDDFYGKTFIEKKRNLFSIAEVINYLKLINHGYSKLQLDWEKGVDC